MLDITVTVADSTLSAQVSYRPLPAGDTRTLTLDLPGGRAVTAPDQYTLPEQPTATPVERPRALFAPMPPA